MAIQKSLESSSLVDVIECILNKGVVIDIWAKVTLLSIDLLAVEARVVIASIDTWLRYAERVGLIEPEAEPEPMS